ncbi:hypothetical protein VTP01DRAFT_10229 [Rhizomucor pusillus]|uniref:uncharacterized protein n=1 Tax=Rhizomucor pusillus TaxID=4840 RepID=UPI0037420A13
MRTRTQKHVLRVHLKIKKCRRETRPHDEGYSTALEVEFGQGQRKWLINLNVRHISLFKLGQPSETGSGKVNPDQPRKTVRVIGSGQQKWLVVPSLRICVHNEIGSTQRILAKVSSLADEEKGPGIKFCNQKGSLREVLE